MELVAGRPAPSDLLSDSAVSVVANAIEAPARTLGEVALLPMDEGAAKAPSTRLSMAMRNIGGVSDPSTTLLSRFRAEKREVAHAPEACRCRPAEPRSVRSIVECAAGVVRET